MRIISKLLFATAALAAAAPAAAQWGYNGYNGYNSYNGYNRYGYSNYGYSGYGYANTSMATQQCTAAVQNRLYNRTSLGSILGSLVGIPSSPSGRVVSVTQVDPRGNGTVRVRGLASSGRYAYNDYGPYGAGAYGAMGYGYANAADLSFRCDVGPNGAVYDVSIHRR